MRIGAAPSGADAVAEHAHTHGRKRTDSFGIRDVVQARWLRRELCGSRNAAPLDAVLALKAG